MANNWFRFKQFTVRHDKCAMKVNTDGVLLGAWAPADNCSTILDIGTGTGVIALMLAQRSTAYIDAVELEENACVQASENVKDSPWSNRIKVIQGDFRQYYRSGTKAYDLIVSNPPYFQNSLPNPGHAKKLARHNDALDSTELAAGVKQLLKPDGRFAVIIPFENKDLEAEALFQGLYLQQETLVQSGPHKPLSRKLQLYGFQKPESLLQNTLSIHNDNGSHTSEYIALTKDFYLKM